MSAVSDVGVLDVPECALIHQLSMFLGHMVDHTGQPEELPASPLLDAPCRGQTEMPGTVIMDTLT